MFRYFLIRTLSLLTFLCASALSQTPIVSYRNGAIPGAAETAAHAAGASLLQRHERMGIAIVQAPLESATAVRASLAADPSVASVVEDRVVVGYAVRVNAATTPIRWRSRPTLQRAAGMGGPASGWIRQRNRVRPVEWHDRHRSPDRDPR